MLEDYSDLSWQTITVPPLARSIRLPPPRFVRLDAAWTAGFEVQQRAPVVVDAAGLAARLGVSAAQVLRLARRGAIPRLKLGHRTVRFVVDDVLAALRASGPSTRPPTTNAGPIAASRSVEPRRRPLASADWSMRR